MSRTKRDTLQAKRKRGLAPWDSFWLSRVPHWHDDMYHTRPARRQEKARLHEALRGGEPTDWPDHRKPEKYYW